MVTLLVAVVEVLTVQQWLLVKQLICQWVVLRTAMEEVLEVVEVRKTQILNGLKLRMQLPILVAVVEEVVVIQHLNRVLIIRILYQLIVLAVLVDLEWLF
tara:strand:- start:23 stop:322 length:300 start_codon:yes stop_codon:yes gene_type:complete